MTQMLQDEREITALVDLIGREGALSYLEIGAKFGGSLRRVAEAMPAGSRIVAVDMPKGTKAWPESSNSLQTVINDLVAKGYDARVIWADSQSLETVERVRRLGPFDAMLIDADHRLPGVTKDWQNYGPMASGLVAFHDIAWRRAPWW